LTGVRRGLRFCLDLRPRFHSFSDYCRGSPGLLRFALFAAIVPGRLALWRFLAGWLGAPRPDPERSGRMNRD
jgi:hypothetical protein